MTSRSQFLEFVRSIDLAFSQYDEQGETCQRVAEAHRSERHTLTAAWPSLIDDYVQYARSRIISAAAEMQAS